jgi:Zn finger protein HypA/HybF involved in hydrogenase expression
MYRAGKFTDPDLAPSFQAWDNLAQQITQKESEKKAIEAEANQPAAPARTQPAAAPQGQAYGHLCSKERIPIPAGAGFCPNCGSPAIDVPPPAPVAAQPATITCSKCSATIPAGAAFCPQCGTAQDRPPS